jgi:hypothetical protein
MLLKGCRDVAEMLLFVVVKSSIGVVFYGLIKRM